VEEKTADKLNRGFKAFKQLTYKDNFFAGSFVDFSKGTKNLPAD